MLFKGYLWGGGKMRDYVICPICSEKFKSLMSHIVGGHRLSLSYFLKKYPKQKLVSESTKNKASKICIKVGTGRKRGFKSSDKTRHKISLATKGKNNPFYGKTHTLSTRRKMSKNHADFTGDKNPLVKSLKGNVEKLKIYKKECVKRWTKIKKNKKKFKAICEANSKRVAALHISNKLKSYGKGHRHGRFYSKKQKAVLHYRSSYELRFLRLCENGNIKSFINCKKIIAYKDLERKNKSYIPDFQISKMIIEIKPKSLLNFSNNRYKFRAGKRYCIKNSMAYILITEKELDFLEKSANILNNLKKFVLKNIRTTGKNTKVIYEP
jgi:hypothetical protein